MGLLSHRKTFASYFVIKAWGDEMKLLRVLLCCLFIGLYIFLSNPIVYGATYSWTNFQDDFSFTGYYPVNSITPSPDNWDKVYVGSIYGQSALFLADYSNGSLTELLPQITSATIDPNEPQHILAIGMVYLSQSTQFNIYESLDGGNTWDIISDANTFGYSATQLNLNVGNLQYSPDGNVVYAYSNKSGYSYGGSGWFFSSSFDNGRTWKAPNGFGKGSGVGPIAVSNSNPNVIYARMQENLYKSVDYGLNWQALPSFVTHTTLGGDLAVDPFDADIVYAVGYDYNLPSNMSASLEKTEDGEQVGQHSYLFKIITLI